jgi:hypothetical protein
VVVIALHVGRAGTIDLFHFGSRMCFAAAFDKNVTLGWELVLWLMLRADEWVRTYLESILSGKALVAVSAREGFDSQVDALVTLEIVVSVEALRALVASERSVGLRVVLWHGVAVQLLHSCMSAVVLHRHAMMRHAVDKRHVPVRITNVGKHRSKQWVLERRALLVRLRLLRVKWRHGTMAIDGRCACHMSTSTSRALKDR